MEQNWWQQGAKPVEAAPAGDGWWKAGAKEVEPAAPKRTALDVAKDVGITALKGAVGLPQSVVGVADLVTGGRAGKAVEDAGVRFKDTQEFLADQYSDAQKAANRKVAEADGFVGTAQAMLENPSTIATSVGESIPQMLGGAGVARGVLATGAKIAPAIAGAIGEGVLGAGSQAEQIRQETKDGLLTPQQAALAAASGVTTTAFGAAGGRVAQRLGIGDADTMLAQGSIRGAGHASQRSLARQVGEGVLSEGVLEEVPQSMAEQALQNLALDKPVGEGVGAAAAQALLAGGAMGGGAALVHGAGARGESAAGAPAPAAAPAAEPLQLGYQPDTLVAFPDGTVGRQAEVDAYLARLPEDQRAAARTRLMGLAPQPSSPTTEAPAGAPAARAALLPSQAMGIDPAAGPLSTGAAIAVDSGAHGQLLQDAQRQADAAALAEQEQATAANRAAPPVLDYSDLDERDRALYDDYFHTLDRETEGHMAAALEDSVPDFGDRNVTDEQFLRALGANDQEIADAIQAARGAAGPEERAGGPVAPAADVAQGAQPAAAAAPAQQGRADPAEAVAAPAAPAATVGAVAAPTSVQDGIARARARRAAPPAQAAAPAPATNPTGVQEGFAQARARRGAAAAQGATPPAPQNAAGEKLQQGWVAFSNDSGTKSVPRAEMPQIRAEHRGAMVNFMNARGIAHAEETVSAAGLKPTQAEFSPERVRRASEFRDGDRAILVSRDGHVLDGHHQWLAAREKGEDVRAIRLDAPIDQLLATAREFPSSTTDSASERAGGSSAQPEVARPARGVAAKLQRAAAVSKTQPVTAVAPIASATTDSVPFKKWFGDSKVVDAEGRPRVMYHGTSASEGGEAFTTFDTYASNYGLMGMGGYFTEDPAVASSYTSKGKGGTPTVYPVYLSIKNPIDMDAKADEKVWKKQFPAAEQYHEEGESNESWYRAAEEAMVDEQVPKWEGAEAMQEGLRAMGFDGITHMGGGRVKSDSARHRVFIAFEPEQVKSAIGNTGVFDPVNPDIRFSFAGARAETADRITLGAAQDRIAAGEDANVVRRETGWHRGVDGRWRFEISDADASLKTGSMSRSSGGRMIASEPLGQLLDHPALFAAYPELRGLNVDAAIDPEVKGVSARLEWFGDGAGRIVAEAPSEAALLSSLLHEVQHGIQHIEGFALGGSATGPYAAGVRDQAIAQNVAERLRAPDPENPFSAGAYRETPEEAKRSATAYVDSQAGRMDAYRRLAGEVEARNTQTRQKMSDAVRRGLSPRSTADVRDADAIVVMNGRVMDLAPMPANARSPIADGTQMLSPAAARAMQALSRPTYSPQARTQAVATVRKTVDAIRSAWGNAPDIVVAFDMNDAAVPDAARRADLRQRSGGARGAPEGFYYRGKAYLMASRLGTAEDAARVLYHEVLGHHGLRGTFGKQLDGVLNQIVTMRRAEVDAKVREYGLRGVNKLDRRAAAEEVLAEMAQNTPELHFVRRAVAAIRTWLRENVAGFRGLRLTDDEIIRNFILPARAFVERSAGAAAPRAGFAFSRAEGVDPDAESRAFLDGAPVAQMSGKEFAPDGVPITEKVTQHYATTGNAQVEVPGIGLVSLDRQAVKSSLFHGIGRDKATAFAAVPDVLKNGKIIHAEAMEGARDAGMVYHVAAPVRIGDRDMVEVVLVKADSNAKRMYVHEVVLREKLQQSAFEAGAGAAGAGVQTRAEAGAIRSVLDRIYSVNRPGGIQQARAARPPVNSLGAPIASSEEGVANFWRWYSAADGNPDTNLANVAGDPGRAAAARTVDGGGTSDVDSVQRSGDLAPNPGATDSDGRITFPGATGPVGQDGTPVVFFHGTRDDFTAFDTDHPNRKDVGWLGRGVYGASDPSDASYYAGAKRGQGGSQVMALYFAVRNPFIIEAAGKQQLRRATQSQVDAFTARLKAQGHDGAVHYLEDGTVEIVAFEPAQVKSAIGNDGTFDPDEADIRFSRSTVGEYARTAAAELNKSFSAPGRLSWWHKTIGTMYNLAERSPAFKPVFDAAQGFVDDVSHYATDAAELAPKLLPKLETWRDIKKSPISAADNTAVAKPVFEGTLTWARDEQGKPVQVQSLIDAAAGLTSEQKAQRLLRNGMLDERMLKAWQGMPLESYEKAVASRYESRMLQPGVVWSDAELRSMFQLTDDQVALYREFREATNRSLDTMARADMLRFAGDDAKGLRTMVMDAPDAQAAAVLIRDHLAQLAADQPDRSTLLMNTANGIMDRADKVRDLQARGYAPLSRFGRYSVDVVDAKGERQYFGLFETAREANTMAARMRGEFGESAVSQGTLSEEAFKVFAGVTPETLELFGNALGLDSTGDRAQDQAFQEYLKLTKTNRSAMRRLIHRKGIAGFSEDVGRVLASFIYSNARQTAAGLNMGDLGEAVNAIPKEQGELKDVAVRLAEYVKNPQEEAQAVRGLLFAQYLGGSIASAFVNMTQPAAVTFPWLSQFGGARKAAAALGTAAKNMATKGFEFEPDLAKALKTAEDDGVVAPQEVHQLMAQARGSGSLRAGDGTRLGEARAAGQNALARLSLAWGKVFGAAEQVNRRITFIAAYRVARDRGEADPAAFASRAVRETQFVYSKASKMQWGRGAVGGVLMTFKTYSIAYLELLHRMYTQGGPEGKRAALLALGMLMLMGGSGGLPFAEDAEDAADALAQLLGYNFSAKKARQEVLEAMLPKGVADFLDKGVSGLPGAPLDVSGRLGMGNLIPGTGLLQQKTSHTRDVLEIAGPAGDFASRIFSGALNVAKGNIGAGALEVAPTAVRNAAKGVDMAATGMYRDAKGFKVLETNHLEAALKAIGFQPQSVATIQEANGINQQAKAFYNLRAQEIRAQWAAGIFEKDEAKVRAAREAIADWNAKNPDQPMLIRVPSVLERVRNMQKSKDQRIADTAPRAMRAQMREELARAGAEAL